ncbi:MAG: hypothetical protein J6O51_03300 [Bacteroidales bacterium]|nr:hypothetical protein [Bacteroidales bacterium]
MKKLIITLAVLALGFASASAQNYDINGIELSSSPKGIESKLRIAFPMHFGFSTPLGTDVSGFPETKFTQNFFYGIEPVSIRFSSETSPFMFSIGLRCTFMDFSLADTHTTFTKIADNKYVLAPITNADYNGKKSKFHGSYVGIPVRFYFTAGRAKLYAGASAEYMFHGWTKYKSPKYREDANGLFNRFRASAEAGVTYGILGLFANYTFTPVLANGLSQAGAISFGLTLGM